MTLIIAAGRALDNPDGHAIIAAMKLYYAAPIALLLLVPGSRILGQGAAATPQTVVAATVRADQPGSVVNPDVYGHFAEHLGRGIYEGLWVGLDSPIPNTRGIRNDVVAALKALNIPVLRWPGGCFADE